MSRLEARLPYILLIAMTVVSFGGPFAILAALHLGERTDWPPEGPLEWSVVLLVVGLVVMIFALCVSMRFWLPKLKLRLESTSRSSDSTSASTSTSSPGGNPRSTA